MSVTSRASRPVVVEKNSTESTAETPPMPTAAARREIDSFSCTAAMTTCSTETREVKPAIASEPKNRAPKIGPPGISETMAGKVTKDSPTPAMPSSSDTSTPCRKARNPSVANTPMPARISKDELANATTRPGLVRFDRRLRYEA